MKRSLIEIYEEKIKTHLKKELKKEEIDLCREKTTDYFLSGISPREASFVYMKDKVNVKD